METDIPSALRLLRRKLDQVLTLLEWKKLFDQERPIHGLSPRRPDPSPKEIAAAFGSALNLAEEIQNRIDGPSDADARQLSTWQDELRHLVLELATLNPTDAFINP